MKRAATKSEKAPNATSAPRARVEIPGRVRDGEVADDADHRGIEQRAGQQSRHGRRAFAMSVGQPRMHGRQAELLFRNR